MSDFHSRFNRLRQQSGGRRITSISNTRSALQERLKTANRIRDGQQKTPPRDRRRRLSIDELAEVLAGQPLSDGVIVSEKTVAFTSPHGAWQVCRAASAFPYFGFDEHANPLFIDTETSGLAGGSGTVVFLLGLAKYNKDGLHLRQYFLSEFRGEAQMLEDAAQFSQGTDLLISYNGKGFDLPLLATRCRITGISNPWASHRHWDLLHGIRRAFREHWPDCRLHSVETRLLRFFRDNDLPGDEVPAAWFAWLKEADSHVLPRVFRHNYWDILSLAASASLLASCYQRPEQHGADPLAAARLLLEQDSPELALEHLLAHKTRLGQQAKLLLANLARRSGNWALALECWRELAQSDSSEALESLAKYYEHNLRDYSRAMRCGKRLMQLEPGQETHSRRVQRLAQKQKLSRMTNP